MKAIAEKLRVRVRIRALVNPRKGASKNMYVRASNVRSCLTWATVRARSTSPASPRECAPQSPHPSRTISRSSASFTRTTYRASTRSGAQRRLRSLSLAFALSRSWCTVSGAKMYSATAPSARSSTRRGEENESSGQGRSTHWTCGRVSMYVHCWSWYVIRFEMSCTESGFSALNTTSDEAAGSEVLEEVDVVDEVEEDADMGSGCQVAQGPRVWHACAGG